jgi:hypothetical protein
MELMVMFLLIVLFNSAPAPDDAKWTNGYYTERMFMYETMAACEAARMRVILAREHQMLISPCLTAKDTTVLHSYPKPEAPAVKSTDSQT